MKTLTTAFVLAALATTPAFAQAYVPNDRLTFTPTEGGVHISGSTGFGARGHWCAAADYALREMGAQDSQKLYVSEPRARGFGGDGGVTFTLDQGRVGHDHQPRDHALRWFAIARALRLT